MTVSIRLRPSPRRRDRCPAAQAGQARQRPLARISNSAVPASCCDGASCSLTGLRSSSAGAPWMPCWSSWWRIAHSSQKKSYSAGCGRAWWYRKKISNLRFTHSVKRSAQTAIRSLRNLAHGYRFTGVLRMNIVLEPCRPMRPKRQSHRIFFLQSCRHSPQCRVNAISRTDR